MPRGKYRCRRPTLVADSLYRSVLVHKLINYVMVKGKKRTARDLVYRALKIAGEKTKREPLEVLEGAVKNASPLLEVRSRRIGGSTYQVPMEVRPERKTTLALRWLVQAAAGKQGRTMDKFLADELLDALKGEGAAIKKRDEMHRMAEANRAFAHFSRF